MIGALLLAGLIITVFKLAILLLVLWGLIFRTSTTVTLLLVGGVLTLLQAHPAAGFGILGAIGLWIAYRKISQTELPVSNEPLALPAPDTEQGT